MALVAFTLASCASTPTTHGVPVLHRTIAQLYQDGDGASRCKASVVCGDFVEVDCGSEYDGPLRYFDNRNGELVMACGGACRAPDSDDPTRCKACPPPQFVAACAK